MQSYDEFVLDILQHLPNESNCIDYKVIGYTEKGKTFADDKKCELLKDILAMANTKEIPVPYCAIIIGVTDDKKKVGIEKESWPDDSTYQPIFSNIIPALSIVTGCVEYQEKNFGYFLIQSDRDKLYSISQHCSFDTQEKVANQYFIRHGSTTTIMTASEVEEFRRQKLLHEASQQQQKDLLQRKQKTLAQAAALGSWNQHFLGDKEFIQAITGVPYEQWIQWVQELTKENQYVSICNGEWLIGNRLKTLQNYGDLFFDEDIERLKNEILKLLSVHHPKYESDSDKRWYSTNKNKYSEKLIKGISEFLAIIGNYKDLLKNTSYHSSGIEEYLIVPIIKKLFTIKDWMIYPTIECGIKFLAEASPLFFLDQMEKAIDDRNSAFYQFLQEKENSFINYSYGICYFYSLKMLAIRNDCFTKSSILLFKISTFRKDALDILTQILLPLCPATLASRKKRTNIFNKFQRINDEIAWTLLLGLLPNMLNITDEVIYPKYLPCKHLPQINSDAAETYHSYEQKALDWAQNSYARQKQLLKCFRNLFPEEQTKLLQSLQIKAKTENNLATRYDIWCALYYQYFELQRIDDSIDDKTITAFRKCIAAWKPHAIYYRAKRLFDQNINGLFLGDNNRIVQRQKQISLQKRWIRRIFHLQGIEGVLKFATYIERPKNVGTFIIDLPYEFSFKEIAHMLSSQNNTYQQVIQGYIWSRYQQSPENIMSFMSDSWSDEQKYKFLLVLPLNKNFWTMAQNTLSKPFIQKYWETKSTASFEFQEFTTEDFDFLIRKMSEVRRWQSALELVEISIDKKRPCQLETMIFVLLQYEQDKITNNDLIQFYIQNIFNYLDDASIDPMLICQLAWRWYPLLNQEDNVFLRTLAQIPKLLVILLKKECEPSENDSERRIATQCYMILKHWKNVPGMIDGIFNEIVFSNWLNKVRDLAEKEDLSKQMEMLIGNVLFYAIDAKKEFFLPGKIAEVLDENENKDMRKGFFFSAVNSLGVHTVNKNNPIENVESQKYQNFAEKADEEGYTDLAATLREIANYFHDNAERIRHTF